MKKIFLIGIVVSLIVSFMYLLTLNTQTQEPKEIIVNPINTVKFVCSESKYILASFYSEKVDVTLSDRRYLSLTQVMSGSGARYANTDETFVFWNKGDTAFIEEFGGITFKDCAIQKEEIKENIVKNNATTSQSTHVNTNVGISNPASTNCEKVGGILAIQKRGDGGEYSLCTFEDNRACEEWALLRGECPVGGRKITGYDTIEQKYCVWLGGQTLASEKATCAFKNGKVCLALDFYNGTCTKEQ
ncbi:MAG: DUF333 domain-containing protein [Candidatus Pacebacteria bacterium]|nr:DUF333 domain-containing protein [Candidatus Paceibacterota bacterium]MBP9867215.1 DUF333 domain-containing protein [Candidatus Paceibacterota bacterium]